MSSRKNVHRNTPEKTRRLGFSTRLLLNFLAVGIAALVFSKVVKNNTSYNWLWFTFAPNNLENTPVAQTRRRFQLPHDDTRLHTAERHHILPL